jgi:hypothetical protein
MQPLQASQGKNSSWVSFTLVLSLVLLLALVLPQAALANPVVMETTVEVSGPPVVAEGEEFEVTVVVGNVTGLFGGQFELSFDPTYLEAVNDSLLPGADLEPSVVGVQSIDNVAGSILFAVSRQGDVEELSGDVVLATVHFVALATVDWTTISLSNVLLGDKNANEIASGVTQDLTLTIVPAGAIVQGQIMLEGRSSGNWDEATVTIGGTDLSAMTGPEGYFDFIDVPLGTYTFTADADGYLPAVCEGLEVMAPVTPLMPIELVAGDVNDDGAINIVDAVAIGAAFGDLASNPAADLNDDGAVNILDLIIMAVNFGASSPTPWACLDP